MRNRRVLGTLLVLVVGGCLGGSDGPVTETIGPTGGTVASGDNRVELTIPPSALADEVRITIEQSSGGPAGAIGSVYEIGPSGTTFAQAVTIALRYDAAELGNRAPADLRVATEVQTSWSLLSDPAVDESSASVSGTVTHLSLFGLVAVVCNADGACSVDNDCDGNSEACTSTSNCCEGLACINGYCFTDVALD